MTTMVIDSGGRINHVVSNVNILDKIFIWSLIAEPMMFFIFSDSLVGGIPFTLSRLFQLMFLLMYATKILLGSRLVIVNFLNDYYQYILAYVLLIIISSYIGIGMGYYSPVSFNNIDSMNVNISNISFQTFLRPFVEIFILCYYFLYFLILPRYILRSNEHVSYLLKWTINIFILFVIAGITDSIFSYFKIYLIPRHLVDSRWVTAGFRFHSFAGEPRDAFVYLLFGMSILYLKNGLYNYRLYKSLCFSVIIFCLVLTQSFSGVIGIVFGIVLLFMFTKLSVINYVRVFIIIFAFSIIVFVALNYSSRLKEYTSVIFSLPEIMNSNKLPYLVIVQAPDIVPLWLFLTKIANFDLYPVLFGSGVGSASYATNSFIDGVAVNNPRAQMTRLLFESGLIGFYIYLLTIVKPVKRFISKIDKKFRLKIWISAMLLFGAVLGHRSNLGLIYAGIILAIIMNDLYFSPEKDKTQICNKETIP